MASAVWNFMAQPTADLTQGEFRTSDFWKVKERLQSLFECSRAIMEITDEERRSFSRSVRFGSNRIWPDCCLTVSCHCSLHLSLSLSLLWPLLLFGLQIPPFKVNVNADHIIKRSFRLCFPQTGNMDFARTARVCVCVCACECMDDSESEREIQRLKMRDKWGVREYIVA